MVTQNPSTFLHFPSPFFLDHDDFLHNEAFPIWDPLFMQDDHQIPASVAVSQEVEIEPFESLSKDSTMGRKTVKMIVKETRQNKHGKKDRHSKIYTARGPRDRRMRLSVQVARRFFDLQDMLGFDKASKTIEWLFSKSKGPIKELTEKATSCSLIRPAACYTISSDRKPRESTWLDPVAKRELRQKARERARERTKQKLKMRFSPGNKKDQSNNLYHDLVSVENPEHQGQYCPNSTFVSESSDSINPDLFNSVLSMNQLNGHEETQYSILIRNYLSTSIFGSI